MTPKKRRNSSSGLFGIVIKVENLDVCRPFYRDLLELGTPLTDSNFWVEFRLDADASLVLEKVMPGEKTPVGRGKLSWFYRVADINKMVAKLKEAGHEPLADEQERLGYMIHMFGDPEGNPFYLYSEPENTQGE